MTSHTLSHDSAEPRPSFSEAQAAKLAFDLYNLSGSVTELTSERDQNFLIETQSATLYFLKIAAAAERKETLEFQNAVMTHLSRRVRSGFIPQARETKAGEEIATVAGESGVT